MARERYLVVVDESDLTTPETLQHLDADVYEVSEQVGVGDIRDTSLEPGDYAYDTEEPTASAEVNTVKVVEVLDERIDEHEAGDSGESVHDYNDRVYAPNDRVVRGYYPNMGGEDKLFSFPADRLREV